MGSPQQPRPIADNQRKSESEGSFWSGLSNPDEFDIKPTLCYTVTKNDLRVVFTVSEMMINTNSHTHKGRYNTDTELWGWSIGTHTGTYVHRHKHVSSTKAPVTCWTDTYQHSDVSLFIPTSHCWSIHRKLCSWRPQWTLPSLLAVRVSQKSFVLRVFWRHDRLCETHRV